jgi:hypothetical protein
MSDAPDVWAVIREECDKHADASDAAIASEVMKRANISTKSAMFLMPVMANAVAGSRRGEVRATERRVFSPRRELGGTFDMVAARSEMVDKAFAVGDGRLVEWLKATVDDHLARIEYLRKFVAGVEVTIASHEEAIAQIRAHNVTCLGEIEDEAE